MMGGGLGGLAVVIFMIYTLIIILSLIVLWRLVVILPILTTLANAANRHLRSITSPDRSPERRLIELEDLLRLNAISSEEYAAKRQEILNDL